MIFRFVIASVLALVLSSTTLPQRKGTTKEKTIAWVGLTTKSFFTYNNKHLDGEPVSRCQVGDKVVVLSEAGGLSRILLESGAEVFASSFCIFRGNVVTLRSAVDKVRFFERASANDPNQTDYYDKQAAPWVALVARELGLQASGNLPSPQEVETAYDNPPSLTVINSTSYTIRVYMTGPRTLTRSIRAGQSWVDEFPDGDYKVLAETTSGNVSPLKTTWTLKRRFEHSITLYIRTSRN